MYKLLTKRISRYLETPPYLILFVSDRCWMKCKHCWFNEDWKKDNLQGDLLTLKELEKLADSINKTLFLSLTGGEAFMRDDIDEIVKLFTKKKKVHRYQIPTSGYMSSLIIEKTRKILSDNPGIPFRIDVSLDGNEEIHEKIRDVEGGFKKAVETITELNKLKKEYSYFDVGVITTLSNYNRNNIEDISEIIEKIHPDGEWMLNIVRGKARNPIAGDVSLEDYSKAGKLIEKRKKEGSYKGHRGHFSAKWLSAKNSVRRKIINKILENNYKGGGCSAGSLGGVVYPDGSVYPCELSNKSFGNLRDCDFRFDHLWNSGKADEIRNSIQDTYCKCTQECFLSVNFLIQPQTWPSLIRERFKLYKNK